MAWGWRGGGAQPGLLCPPQRLVAWEHERAGPCLQCFCMCRPCPCGSPVRRHQRGAPYARTAPNLRTRPRHVPDATLRFSGELDSVLKPIQKQTSTNYLKKGKEGDGGEVGWGEQPQAPRQTSGKAWHLEKR